jgi:hypothetical protein
METNDNKGQLKKLGKIEGVIYVESDNGSAPVNNQQGDLPFPDAGLPPQPQVKPKLHKERKQDILVHCPASLHSRLVMLKAKIYDDSGQRVTINNMIVDAIAAWLDEHESKVSATT